MQFSGALGRMISTSEKLPDFNMESGAQPGALWEEEPQPVFRRPAPQRKPAPQNILSLAKARLRDVKSELKKLKALEKERGELERLIAAAEEKKPRAVLREIKRTAG
jgi:hypothetical protein